ncbi:hypothetical protein B296_00016659, partial [Ensete ventricosum]
MGTASAASTHPTRKRTGFFANGAEGLRRAVKAPSRLSKLPAGTRCTAHAGADQREEVEKGGVLHACPPA